jgi:hypothetical protein
MAPIAITEPHASSALEPIAIIGMGELPPHLSGI